MKYLISFLFMVVFCTTQTQQTLSQQRQITRFSPEGVRQTIGFEVKFKVPVLNLPKGQREGQITSINSQFPNVIEFFQALEYKYGNMQIFKQLPNEVWGDTLRMRKSDGKLIRVSDLSQLFYIKLTDYIPIDEIVKDLLAMPEVAYAHQPVEVVNLDQVPNDPKYATDQWNLTIINAPKAWDITKGNSNITIAIFESAIASGGTPNFGHEDLASKWNSSIPNQTSGNGTHASMVAGIAGAVTNNGKGIASLGWNLKLSGYSFSTGQENDLLPEKLLEAAQYNEIINCSFTTIQLIQIPGTSCTIRLPTHYQSVQDAISRVVSGEYPTVVTASAGNSKAWLIHSGDCTDDDLIDYFPYSSYPAAYDTIIAVSATGENDIFAEGSTSPYTTGGNIDVAAPGMEVLSTWSTDGVYYTDSGTSFSSPHVAALAGLILSLNSDLSNVDVEEIVATTADKVGLKPYNTTKQYGTWNSEMGYGRINAYDALKYTLENYGGTLSGEVTLTEDLNIQNGATLTIAPGCSVKFAAPGVDLWINSGAKLVAVGTGSQQSQSITFTSAQANPGRKSWGTIFLHTSNNQLEYCTVEYGDWGVKVYGYPGTSSGNVIKNCTTRNNDQGVRIENTSVTVENTTIENNRHAFINFLNSTSTLKNNTVRQNDRDGIYSLAAIIDLYDNLFENNGLGNTSTYHGIYAGLAADISLGSRSFSANPATAGGYNTIRNNHGAGILVTSFGTVTAGVVNSGPLYLAGNNSIHSNGTQTGTSYTGKDFYNVNSTTQMAENNYWGGTCPPAVSQIYGSVDTDFCLTTSPTSLSPMPKPGILAQSNGTADLDTQTKLAIINQNKQIIATQPNTQAAVDALQQYYSFVRTDDQDKLGQRTGMYTYLDGIYKQHSTIDLGKTALQLMIIESRRTDDLATAIALSEKALAEVSPSARSGIQFNLIFMYIHGGQLTNAQNMFADYKTRYPKDLTAIEILEGTLEKTPEMYARTGTKVQGVMNQPDNESTLELLQGNSGEEALFQSYPNPFNPETTIMYQLPEAGHVSLKIYSILGQEIRTLVDDEKQAGYHRVIWDGSNDVGLRVESGMYFVRIESGQAFVRTQKVVLLK